jgi:hypothetical protein
VYLASNHPSSVELGIGRQSVQWWTVHAVTRCCCVCSQTSSLLLYDVAVLKRGSLFGIHADTSIQHCAELLKGSLLLLSPYTSECTILR